MGGEGYRERCLRSDGEECWVCSSADEVEVHHINGNHPASPTHPDNQIENLVPLCKKCHARVHSEVKPLEGRLGALQAQLWRSRADYPSTEPRHKKHTPQTESRNFRPTGTKTKITALVWEDQDKWIETLAADKYGTKAQAVREMIDGFYELQQEVEQAQYKREQLQAQVQRLKAKMASDEGAGCETNNLPILQEPVPRARTIEEMENERQDDNRKRRNKFEVSLPTRIRWFLFGRES